MHEKFLERINAGGTKRYLHVYSYFGGGDLVGIEKQREYCKKYYWTHREENLKACKENRKMYIDAHICVRCRDTKAVEGKTMCQNCLDYMAEYRRQLRERKKSMTHGEQMVEQAKRQEKRYEKKKA